MELYVIRHGIAEDLEPGQDDAERKLTKDGKKKLRRVAKGLRKQRFRFDRILTSPWTRARQTAERLDQGDPMVTDLLARAPRSELLSLLAGDRVAVVGHQPWLGELIALLALGETRHGDVFDLKKAGVAILDGTPIPGGMTLRAVLPPTVW